MISPNGGAEPEAVIRAELDHQLAFGWHHLSVRRNTQILLAQVDHAAVEQCAAPIEDAELLIAFRVGANRDFVLDSGRKLPNY